MSENRKPTNAGGNGPKHLNDGEQRSFGNPPPDRSERKPPTNSGPKKS